MLCALVMALSLMPRNCPRESPRAGAASLQVGVVWEDEGRGAGERRGIAYEFVSQLSRSLANSGTHPANNIASRVSVGFLLGNSVN